MNVELPGTQPYGALFVVGTHLAGATVETIGSVIVKAGYRLTAEGGAGVHVMTPDAAGSVLVLADQISGDDVVREADIAPVKPLSDIVVQGFSGVGDPGTSTFELRLDDIFTLRRIDALGLPPRSTADRTRHLFGYEPRAESPRKDDAVTGASDPDPKSLDKFATYSDQFLNFHRRGPGFQTSGALADALTGGQRVAVLKDGAEIFSVTLPLPRLSALYRTWCGHGPDKAPYWTRTGIGPMRADTLILHPAAGTAEVIWRATWPWNAEPKDRYRAIRVTEEAT